MQLSTAPASCIIPVSACVQVLLRALRDFNLGKLTADDTGIFTGLLDDLFPKVAAQVPRARDVPFEAKVRPLKAS